MTQRNSVLFVTTIWRTLDGFLDQHAEYLQEHGWHVHAAANLSDMPVDRLTIYDSVHDLPWSRSSRRPDLLARGALALHGIVKTVNPDIVHIHTPIASAIGRALLGGRRRPPIVVHTAHGFHFHQNGSQVQNAAATLVERLMRFGTDHLFTINLPDTLAARAMLGYPADKVTRLDGIGIDLDYYATNAEHEANGRDLRARLGIPSEASVIGFVGALNQNKRPFDAIEAFRSVRCQAHLVIAGDGPLRADLEADGDARIHFLGRVDDVRPVISAADVVVSCSKREGLPRSLLESLAGATPIISSSCRGSEDLAAVPEAVFDVGNPSALSDLLNRTLPDPEMLQRILRAQTKHLERFSFAGVADAQRKVYEDLLTR